LLKAGSNWISNENALMNENPSMDRLAVLLEDVIFRKVKFVDWVVRQ